MSSLALASSPTRPTNIRSAPRWLKIPTLDSEESYVRDFILRTQNRYSPRRRWHTQRAAQNLWFYLGRQWIEACTELAPANGTYHFREIFRRSNAAFPRPVDNVIAQAVDNELARLTRKEYTPDPTLGRNEPEWMAAARLAKDIVTASIAKQAWGEKWIDLHFDLLINSVAIARTWWDENETETTLVAPPGAMICPSCQRRFSSAQVPHSFLSLGLPTPEGPVPMRNFESAKEIEPTGEMSATQAGQMKQLELRHCPFCEMPTQLKEYQVGPEEALQTDAFDRPLGMMLPRGEDLIDVVNLHEYFPENGGVGVEPHNQKIFSQEQVRQLEWIALHYPELEKTLEPEDPGELLRCNPLYAERALSVEGVGVGGAGYESNYNHARVRELIVSPMPFEGLERGAWFIMVNDHVVKKELCVEVEGDDDVHLVPRVKYHFARFKRIPKHFWGRSFVDDMIPQQRRLNEIDAQSMDLRERGKPNIWIPNGTEIYAGESDAQGSLAVIEYDAALSGWSPKDGIFPGIALNGDAYLQERDQVLQALQRAGAPQDIEMGQAPGSVKTTSGLMLLSEETAAKRAPRERAMLGLCEGSFGHVLELNWAFRKEEATLEVQRAAGTFERETYTGEDLLGPFKVKMSARVAYDQVLYNKEAAGEAMQLGLYVIDSPVARDRVLDLMKLPKDVNEGTTLQITRAHQAWSDFKKKRRIPVIDPTLHDPATWSDVLGRAWFTDEAQALQESVEWDGVLPRLAGWQERMAQMEAAEAPAKAVYGNAPPEQWPAIYQQGSQLVAQAQQAYQEAEQSFQKASAGAPPGAAPLQPPPPPAMTQFPQPPQQPFLPDPLEQKIYAVWLRMVPEFGIGLEAATAARELDVPLGDEVKKVGELDALLKFYAVLQAYRLMLSGALGGMVAPAPGATAGPGTPPGPPGLPVGGPSGAPGALPPGAPPGPPRSGPPAAQA